MNQHTMKLRWHWSVLWMIGALFTPASGAVPLRTPLWQADGWTTDTGLPHNYVQALLQTREGHLWLGTQDGLGRFDGERFTIFRPRDTPGLVSANVVGLLEDRQRQLWIATEAGLNRLSAGRWQSWGKTAGLLHTSISVLCEGTAGELWFGTTDGGVYRFAGDQFTRFGKDKGLPDDTINALALGPDGTLWIGTDEGLASLSDGTIRRHPQKDVESNHVLRLYLDPLDGTLWISYADGRLSRLKNGKFLPELDPQLWSHGHIKGIFRDFEGTVWLAAYGVGVFQMKDGHLERIDCTGPLGADHFLCAIQDREGNAWFGTSIEGLKRVRSRAVGVIDSQRGLTDDGVLAVSQSRDGSLWIGTYGGGLNHVESGRVSNLPDKENLPHACLYSVLEDRLGDVWVGTSGAGLFRYRAGHFERCTKRDGIGKDSSRALAEDRSGTLWIGTAGGGLTRWRDGQFTTYTTRDGLSHDDVRAIAEDPAGALWIGTYGGGINRLENGVFTVFRKTEGLSHEQVMCLYADADGTLWIGTFGGGLNRYHRGRFTSFTRKDGLFDDVICGILEDNLGNLWLSSYHGICRVPKADLIGFTGSEGHPLTGLVLGKSDGLPSTECPGGFQPSAWKARDGSLCFPTARGLAVIDPNRVQPQPAPAVLLESIVINGQTNDMSSVAGRTASAVEIPPGAARVEFRYGAISLAASEKLRFRYRLQGWDKEWHDAEEQRSAPYSQLAAGDYKFEVQASHRDGLWTGLSVPAPIRVLPYFWERPISRVVGVAAGLGLLAWMVRGLSVRKMKRRLAFVGQQHVLEQERRRIAQDMHDDLGCSLTQIALLTDQLGKQLSHPEQPNGLPPTAVLLKIATTARDSLRSLEEIVWAVHPENDTLDHLASYLCQYAEQLFRSGPIRCRVDAPAALPHHALSAETRHNLVMLVKETLNNVVKHSQAREVWLRLTVEGNRLVISIEDDGRGFADFAGATTGDGLPNMRKRCACVGGVLRFETRPGQGTTVSITVPLHLSVTMPASSEVPRVA